MFLIGISGQSGGFDPLVLLLIGLLLEALVGNLSNPSQWSGNPLNLVYRYGVWCAHKLNRESRSERDRGIRGGLALLLLITLSAAFGWLIASLSQKIQLIWFFEVTLIVLLINQRGTHAQVQRIIRALKQNDLITAQSVLSRSIDETANRMDADQIARTGFELCAVSLAKDVVAPVFWYILFGLPGLLVFVSVSNMNQIVGKKTEKYRAFGFAASRLNDILQFVPTRIAGIFVVLGAIFVPTAKPYESFKVMYRDATKFHSYVIGWPLSAMVGALRLAFPNDNETFNKSVSVSWIGDGSPRITTRDVGLALYLFTVSCLLNVAIVAGLTVFRIV